MRPARRAKETPMMSAKQKRFHSSPSGPHQSPPSLSTPSTSMASARICLRRATRDFLGAMQLDRGSYAAKLFDDGEFAFIHTFDSVTLGLLPQSDIAYEPRNPVRFERRSVVGTPHGTIHGDVALYAACSKRGRADTRGNACLVSRIADGNSVARRHGWNGAQVEFRISSRVGAGS